MDTKTVLISTDWTLVTNKVALLQFNDEMFMYINTGATPEESAGFRMLKNEKYVNSVAGIHVWAKAIYNITKIPSVRAAEV